MIPRRIFAARSEFSSGAVRMEDGLFLATPKQ
jgi:hypothetical protein